MRRPRPLEPDRAWPYLLDLLSRRDYTIAELASKLRRRGLDDDVVAPLLARLQELGLANDERYAEQYVASRRKARGRLALRRELQHRGIDASVVERELAPLSDQDQIEAATELLRRSAWRYQPGSLNRQGGRKGDPALLRTTPSEGATTVRDAGRVAARERARAFAFLARRGFTAGVAGAAIAALGWWRDDA